MSMSDLYRGRVTRRELAEWTSWENPYANASIFRDRERYAQCLLPGSRDAELRTVTLPHVTFAWCDYVQTTTPRTEPDSGLLETGNAGEDTGKEDAGEEDAGEEDSGKKDAKVPIGRSKGFITELRFRDGERTTTISRTEFVQTYLSVKYYLEGNRDVIGLRVYAWSLSRKTPEYFSEWTPNYLGFDMLAIQKGVEEPLRRAEAVLDALKEMVDYLTAAEEACEPTPEWIPSSLRDEDDLWAAATEHGKCERQGPMTDFALRLARHVRTHGLPFLPDDLIVWGLYSEPRYHSPFGARGEGNVKRHVEESAADQIWAQEAQWSTVPEEAQARLGVSELMICKTARWASEIRFGNRLTTSWHKLNFDEQRLRDIVQTKEPRAWLAMQQYAAVHPGVIDLEKLRPLQAAYIRKLRGLHRVLVLALNYLNYFEFSDQLPPPWAPWTLTDSPTFEDERADPADLTAITENGALSEYVFYLKPRMRWERHLPKDEVQTPDCIPARPEHDAYDRAKNWSRAQNRAKACSECRKLGRPVKYGMDTGASTHSDTPGPDDATEPAPVATFTLYPECSHKLDDMQGCRREAEGIPKILRCIEWYFHPKELDNAAFRAYDGLWSRDTARTTK